MKTGSEANGRTMGLVGHDKVLDLTIGWLVQNRETSVRLVNCVTATPSIRDLTVRGFLNNPSKTRNLVLETRRLGRKTADELIALISSIAAEHDATMSPAVILRETDEKIAFHTLVRLLSAISFPAALLTLEMSARLRNCLNALTSIGPAGSKSVTYPADLGAVLSGWSEFSRRLIKQPNFGRTTIKELAGIIEGIVSRKLGESFGSGTPFLGLSILDLAESRLSPAVVETLLKLSNEMTERASDLGQPNVAALLHGADPDAGMSPLDHVRVVVSRLPTKECDVVVRRYGFRGRVPETLEQVAAQFHVTRERVRQVEAKALTRLRVGANRRAFERLLEAEGESIWNVLSGGSDLLLPSDLQEHRSAITVECMLAVEVVHGRLFDWVASVSRPALGGFLRGSVNVGGVRESAGRLADWAADAPGPVRLEAAMQVIGASRDNLAVAMKLLPGIRTFEGYICPGHFGPQVRRTCRLHDLALNWGNSQPVDFSTLYSSYASEYPADEVSRRVIHVQLQRAPHLFLRLFDQLWIAVGSGAPLEWGRRVENLPFETAPYDAEPEFEAGTIGAWLYAALASGGPTRAVDLKAQAEVGIPQRISQSSVGAVLQSNPDFVRLAPGVYGLQRHVDRVFNPLVPVAPAMLSDAQCRYYATARMAGDPVTLYPAWNYRLEAALCQWASVQASDDNYRSMLAVSTPSEWGLEQEEERNWQDRKRVYGSFRLPRLDPPQTMRLPSASAFVSAAAYLCLTGSIAWTTVNRAAQRRIDDQKAASTLALLVRFGLAAEPEEWHGRYPALPYASVIMSRIVAHLSAAGSLSWDEGPLAEIREGSPIGVISLFDARQVDAMLAGGDDLAESSRMMESGKPADLDSLFDSDEWGAAFLPDGE